MDSSRQLGRRFVGDDARTHGGLWIERAKGELQLAVRDGDAVSVADETVRFDDVYDGKIGDDGGLSFAASSISDQA